MHMSGGNSATSQWTEKLIKAQEIQAQIKQRGGIYNIDLKYISTSWYFM